MQIAIWLLEQIEETTGSNPEQVSADAGYRGTQGLVELEKREIDGVVPIKEANLKQFGLEHFSYEERDDLYVCPEDRELEFSHIKPNGNEVYRSHDCSGCSMAEQCVRKIGTNRSLEIHPDVAVVQRMQDRMKQEDAPGLSKKRAQTVEIVFAWLKVHRKLRQFTFRGLNNVKEQWNFELAVINMQRIISFSL